MKIRGIKWLGLFLGVVAGSLLLTTAWSAQLLPGALPAGHTWAPARGEVVTSVYKVDNLSCSVCLDSIDSALRQLPGTLGLDADLANQVVFVDHQKELSEEEIGEKITAAGYPASLLGSGRKVRATGSSGSVAESAAGWNSGCNRRSCGATAKEWKQLFNRYFAK